MKTKIKALFLDVGNVVLTNGWDHHSREKAALKFNLNYQEMNARHALIFDTYEIGKITLDQYIEKVVFYEERNFSLDEFKTFMFEQSRPLQNMLDLFADLKKRFNLRIVAVSNEGKELMLNRIEKFKLRDLYDIFICSGFVGLRKPDLDIFKLALSVSQFQPDEVIYVDDRKLLAEIVQSLGMDGVHHIDYEITKNILEKKLT